MMEVETYGVWMLLVKTGILIYNVNKEVFRIFLGLRCGVNRIGNRMLSIEGVTLL